MEVLSKSTSIISYVVTKINQKTNLTFINLSYHILATFHIISKTNFQNFAQSFGKNILTLDPIPNDLKSFLVYKFTCASCSSKYIDESVVILKLGLSRISKRVTSIIFLNICYPMHHDLIHIILFVSKFLIKINLNSI